LARFGAVVQQGFVAQEQYDTALAAVATLEASVKGDEAALDLARLRRAFCDIRAPIGGVAGSLKVHRGNLVKANDNDRPLVNLLQVEPIQVAFSLPERHLGEIRRRMGQGVLAVSAALPEEEGRPVEGQLAFIENSVDVGSGSIPLRAAFPNADRRLWPGQFVSVHLTLSAAHDAVVVPSQAIQSGQQGPYLYVLQPDQTVAYRSVETGHSGEGLTVIRSGVAAGEQVVTEGQLRLSNGARVTTGRGAER
jgi:multidrug efflux system membrane fusion protein